MQILGDNNKQTFYPSTFLSSPARCGLQLPSLQTATATNGPAGSPNFSLTRRPPPEESVKYPKILNMQPPKNKTAKPTKAKRTPTLVSSNSLSSSPGASLIFALLFASYPQAAGAAPGTTSQGEDLRLSKKSLSKRNLQSDSYPVSPFLSSPLQFYLGAGPMGACVHHLLGRALQRSK